MLKDEDLIFENIKHKSSPFLNGARERGIWQVAREVILSKSPEEIINIVKDSGLRGRGGAGFSTGMKWSFMPKTRLKDVNHYLIVNADESEPGTCKDREIILWEPHKLLESILISAYAVNANICYIYIRGEFVKEAEILQKAIDEAYEENLIGKNAFGTSYDLEIYLHRGMGAYICGEETALLESLEGKKGMPRLKPPFPAVSGLYGSPTTINNVESIANISTIFKRGVDFFKSFGYENNYGTKLFCISGHVNNPCVIEEEMGVSLRYLIDHYAKGVIGGWENLQAIIPGGSSMPLIPSDFCDNANMDYDSLKKFGTMLGTGGIIVINKDANITAVIARISKFYMHESCGQCTPCREGTGWIWRIMQDAANKGASKDDIEKLKIISKNMEGNTICALADAASWPVQALIKHFENEMLHSNHKNKI